MTAIPNRSSPLERALISLDGLSVGDAFGEMLSTRAKAARRIVASKQLPPPGWWHTDDTQMAMAIVEELKAAQTIDPARLGERFAARYDRDPERGYGKGARMVLRAIFEGTNWQVANKKAFSCEGSKGNGGAMRVAPLGAYFADDLPRLVHEARQSCVPTHSHPEGIAGAIAVAVAAGVTWQNRLRPLEEARQLIWKTVLELTPAGETHDALVHASDLPPVTSVEKAAQHLGSGFLVTAPDTVPFAIWCAARHLDNFSEALISTLEGDGDCDTNCAIVGGIVSLYTGREGIPAEWLTSRERLNLE
ncbi:ADP-ribosylglycohydrolase family protein [Pedosphaera parvula]|uniref:ADP-ribosylation/Crystallin J1 n=1 Tax=Pedosphaera parvula (strain Ellin514) TaxID=320771 RepID=B9XEF8_PEDPL|nr:ADP-ribosylglycohydrolase family protein [Pedosphaera parvula]EEF61672.1 ADP-ribosylation/Crystallin J1 [Pedosphaera parvula Ellin514]